MLKTVVWVALIMSSLTHSATAQCLLTPRVITSADHPNLILKNDAGEILHHWALIDSEKGLVLGTHLAQTEVQVTRVFPDGRVVLSLCKGGESFAATEEMISVIEEPSLATQ